MHPLSRAFNFKTLATVASLLGLSASPSAQAWDADITLYNFGSSFYVSSWSGSSGTPWTWTTIREGVSATFNDNGTIPNEFSFQNWDGNAWPAAEFASEFTLPGYQATTKAYWSRYEAETELADSADAFVYGTLSNGESMGAQFVYDFQFTLDPFSFATITYADDDASVYLEALPGEEGHAFAGLQLYSTDVDINAPGGANHAYFSQFMGLTGSPAGGVAEGYLTGMEYTFSNLTGESRTYNLRLEGYASVFTTPVPEPGTYAMLLAGLGLVGFMARRHGKA